MRGFYGDYTTQFDKVVQFRATRDKVLNDEMNPLGAAMRANLTKVRESAQADGDFRAAALAGAVQENLILARLNAVRFVGSPDAKLVETANQQLAQLPATVAELEAALQNPERKRLVHEVGQSLPKYAAAFKAMSTATLDMYGLINGSMAKAAEEVAKRTTAVKQSQIGAPGAGCRGRALAAGRDAAQRGRPLPRRRPRRVKRSASAVCLKRVGLSPTPTTRPIDVGAGL
jgi:methyl-accepting chemotaxis protein